ncbi:tRNA dimethylallyltransferase [Pontiella desulfatans]|uniref:tRNA dimethylallyltransferase n=1 Tax=Pontiella desulfatans TaxID=2750659 RepID=A0A6C2U585_PONDE|nr:tRNA (adenosine(37)-N6)-dimethylallyltransferase MiaA [Pontiella desulfatans]VGO15222.1 tRNA dimethylallyltransferase [Pontiella desulfatans]
MASAFFLVGTTASGKSAVAQHIAEHTGHLIVSADSMNLYRGMDIGTAKPSLAERAKADYAGFDLAEPTEKFNVSAYLDAVRPAFESGREIIVAGGTGLYVKCLTEGFDDVPPEVPALRAELEALDYPALEKRAKEEAPALYQDLTEDDRQNPRRLIRIIERTAGVSPAPQNRSWNTKPKPTIVGLHVEREVLLRRIERRVEQMYGAGLLEEARELIKLDLSQTALQAIGYAEAFGVLNQAMTLEQAKERTIIRTRQLAKRQMTWFRNQLHVEWVGTADYPTTEKLAEAVSDAWKKHGATPVEI